jgi:methionyl-tRNA formyltransferase
MRIVFFTSKSSYGAAMLRQIQDSNIPLEAIFVQSSRRQGYIMRLRQTLKRAGPLGTLRIVLGILRNTTLLRAAEAWRSDGFYRSYSSRVYVVDDFNRRPCEQLLAEIGPDVIVLGRLGIIRRNIIKTAKIGVLNAHPGLLPKYRGVDVIPWSIYNGDDIGVTVHFVDEGVDTGGIVTTQVINIECKDTIHKLRIKAERVAAELMAKTILKIMDGEYLQVVPQSKEDGKQCYKMPVQLLRETEKKLARMTRELESNKV